MAAMEAEWLLDKKVEVGHAWGPTKWGGIFGFDPYWPIPIVSHSYIPISREKGQQIPIPIQAPEIPRNSSLNHVKSPSIPHNMVPIWSPSPKFWARHMHECNDYKQTGTGDHARRRGICHGFLVLESQRTRNRHGFFPPLGSIRYVGILILTIGP